MIVGCSQPSIQSVQIRPSEKTPSRVLFSDDSLSAVIIVGDDLSQVDELRSVASTPVSINFLIDALFPEIHDSTKLMYATKLLNMWGQK